MHLLSCVLSINGLSLKDVVVFRCKRAGETGLFGVRSTEVAKMAEMEEMADGLLIMGGG